MKTQIIFTDHDDKVHSVRFNDRTKDSPLPSIYVPRKTLAAIGWIEGDALSVTIDTTGGQE